LTEGTEQTHAVTRRLARALAFIFDMDGTLVLGDALSGGHKALPGAVELLRLLKQRKIPFRVFTNGTAKSPADYAASLRRAGLDLEDAEMMTPSTTAAAWFLKRGIRRVRVLGLQGAQAPLRDAGIEVVGPSESADGIEAVFTAWFRDFTFPDLDAACHDVWAGALLTTASNVRFFATQAGRAIGSSYAINAMIHSMTGKRARVLGKPSRDALHCALSQMGLPQSHGQHTVVVGDDPALEMRMAHNAGAMGVAVVTGLNDHASFARGKASELPHAVFTGLGPIVEALS
jgi:HAD superfamily hydrolase (TIGR01450 family)